MRDIILKAENISKQYRLGLVGTGTISHDLNRWWHKIRGKEDPYLRVGESNDRSVKGNSNYVWALQDVNFEVKRGEVLGIIGKNGAGKSTLLKILSKVTGPTTGEIKTKGRIASLLEVGTGFHGEMTGRENIFLNGAILGMTKKEIRSKIDDIIEFSGCERYIDTPVKRYSSGMTVRLAFAVAAFLEPEILVIDEVLAVGDAEFQKKAIGKMQDISRGGGRTVLFVSHNMASVKSLCTRGIVLEHGKVTFEGSAEEAVASYLSSEKSLNGNLKVFENDFDKQLVKLETLGVKNTDRVYDEPIVEDSDIEVNLSFLFKAEDANKYSITYHLHNDQGDTMFSFYDRDFKLKIRKGKNKINCIIPKDFLQSGSYSLSLFIVKDKRVSEFVEKNIFYFNIVNGTKEIGAYSGREPGHIKPSFEWKNIHEYE
ncbi:ABC transporter ATP-binding protein [Pontimicrobium sp. MEBiC06410]